MEKGGIGGFSRAALRQLIAPEWRGLSLALFALLTATNALMALHDPHGGRPDSAYSSALGVQAIGILSISVAMLRDAVRSPRKRWATDAAFWLYFALSLPSPAIGAAAAFAGLPGPVAQTLSILLVAPITAWCGASAVEEPLAANPRPWLAGMGRWLPAVLLLDLPLIALGVAHIVMNDRMKLLAGAPGFWPLAGIDGIVWTLVGLGVLALQVTAYRAVARG